MTPELSAFGTPLDPLESEQDVSAFGTPLDPVEPDRPSLEQPTRTALETAPLPDKVARNKQLSDTLGLPADFVERESEWAEREYRLRQIAGQIEDAPATAAVLSNPDSAKLAHDDVENLAATEREAKTWMGLGKNTERDLRLVGDVGRSLIAGGNKLNEGLWGIVRFVGDANAKLNSVLGLDPSAFAALSDFAKWGGEGAAANTTMIAPDAATTDLHPWVQSGLQSAGMMGALALTGGGGAVTLGGMSAAEFGTSYAEGRGKGLGVGAAAGLGAANAVAEYVTEKIPVGRLFKDFAGNVSFGKILMRQMATEIPGEQVATVWQDFNDWMIANPEKTLSQFIDERPGRIAETLVSTLVAVGATTGAAGGVRSVMNAHEREREKAEGAVTDIEHLTRIVDASAASQYRARDPQAFNRFLTEATTDENGEAAEVFIDGRAFAQTLADGGVEFSVLQQSQPEIAAKIVEAVQFGGDVVMPMADFATTFAGTPMAESMLQFVRTSADGMSMAEAQVFAQNEPAAFEAAVAAANETIDGENIVEDSLEAVRADIAQQLGATQRFSGEVNNLKALLASSFYESMSAKLGVTPGALYERHRLNIAGENPAAPGQVLNATDDPQFSAWFGDSKVVDESGAPLRVYHGTTRTFETFDPDAPRTALPLPGMFFSPHPEVASNYAGIGRELRDDDGFIIGAEGGNVVPAYLSLKNPAVLEYEDRATGRMTDYKRVAADLAAAKAAGHDGAVIRGWADGSGPVQYVAFHPEQIKSVFNRGTWDANDPNVLNQKARPRGRPVPAAVDATTNVDAAFRFAGSQRFKTNRDFKLALQERALAAAKDARVDLADFSQHTEDYLVRVAVNDALAGLRSGTNAVGWYDEKTRKALAIVSLIHPEVATDPQAKLAFVWAMAVTSNGLKIDKNFELAERAYSAWKTTGKMPTDVGVGQAQKAINDSLGLFNTMLEDMGFEALERFMTTQATVKEINAVGEKYGSKVGGENLTTRVYGSAILGPKIGNGFFSNLYGRFEQLTIDRWLMRTWGRWSGTLIEDNRAQARRKREQLGALVRALSPQDRKALETITGKIKLGDLDAVAEAILKANLKPANRAAMLKVGVLDDDALPGVLDPILGVAGKGSKRSSLGDEIRKAGNSLAKYNDGQKEAPKGPPERAQLRTVLGRALAELQQEMPALTMADLQAVLWYPEKRLYDAAKVADDATTEEEYTDDEAPDYANAAAKLARSKGVDEGRIAGAVAAVDAELAAAVSAAGARSAAGGDSAAEGAGEDQAGTAEAPQQQFAVDPADPAADQVVVNIGLATNDGGTLTEREAIGALEALGVRVMSSKRYESDTEPTLVAQLSRKLEETEVDALSATLRQDAIAQMVGGRGDLWGPKKEAWGPFNPAFFIRPDGTRADTFKQSAPLAPIPSPTVGVHFSRGLRTSLDGRYYGRGAKGEEAARLADPDTDPRLRDRVYAYVDWGNGITPEGAVGGVAHEVALPELYDWDADPLRLRRPNDPNGNESRVLDAGFGGYFVRDFGHGQGAAVILGEATHGMQAKAVPTPARPQRSAPAPTRYTTALMSSEIKAIDEDVLRAAAPTAKVRSGTFSVDISDLTAAREVLSKMGVKLPEQSLNQAVFHGTPHEFEHFSFDEIGSGEGAQVYGWGLYFADAREVAADYRKKLSATVREYTVDGKVTPVGKYGSVEHVVLTALADKEPQRVHRLAEDYRRIGDNEKADALLAKLAEFEDRAVEERHRPGGRLLRADVPDEAIGRMLLWDKPLSEQPEAVKAALAAVDAPRLAATTAYRDAIRAGADEATLDALSAAVPPAGPLSNLPGTISGSTVYELLESHFGETQFGADRAASEYLASIGIPGNRYLDGGSRGKGGGTYNTVVWDQAVLDEINASLAAEMTQRMSSLPVELVTEPIGYNEPDDGFVYHITSAPNAERIVREGFNPRASKMFKSGAYPAHSKGRVFFTDRSGVPFWSERVEQHLFDQFDDPPEVAVIRVPKAAIANLQPDETGTNDAKHPAYFVEGGDLTQRAEQPRGTFSPSTTTITLLEKADLSTFLHELGHFGLDMMVEIASQPGAPQTVVDDVRVTLDWFGVDSIQTWRAMSLDEQRPFHEQFAEGFETYLFEGKAPSAKLNAAFSRFSAWMKSVYKRMTSQMRVQLTDEVRGVFDRMIATNDQIAEQSRIRNMAPMFESAEQAGMTPEQWTDYQNLGAEATRDAISDLQSRSLRDMRWGANAKGRMLKKLQASAKDARKNLRGEIESQVDKIPVYAAIRFLATGEMADTDLTNAQRRALDSVAGGKTKLSLPILKEMYGASWHVMAAKLQPLGAAENGAHPDAIATAFGFDSGDALVRAILAAEPRNEMVEAMTDKRMLEEHGELVDPDSIERAAEAAIHNDLRVRFVATEYAALRDAMNIREKVGEVKVTKGKSKGQIRDLTVNALVRAAGQYADQIVGRTVVHKLNPTQHARTAAQSAKLAREAMAAGKTAEAITHKRNQLLHEKTSRAMSDARAEAEKARAYLAKFRRSNRARGSIDADYIEQIDNILAVVDTRVASGKRIEAHARLVEWVKEQESEGLPVSLDTKLVASLNVTHLGALTVNELRALVDQVKSVEHLGKLKKKLLTAREQRDFDAAAELLAASIREHGGKAKPMPFNPSAAEHSNLRTLRGFFAEHRKLSSLARQMDGVQDDGVMWRYFIRPMNDAGNRESTLLANSTKALQAIFDPIRKLPGGMTGDKRMIASQGVSMSRETRLAIALNWGNETNRSRVLNHMSQAAVDEVFALITPAEWTAVQATWDHINEYWPDIAAKQKRVTGVEPEKVEAAPFEVNVIGGQPLEMRGGYYPIVYESEMSDMAYARQVEQIAKEMRAGAYTAASTRRGHVEKRAADVSERLQYTLNIIERHVSQVVHDLSWHEYLIDANRLMRDGRIAGAIREHYGNEVLRSMRKTLEDIATGDLQRNGDFERISSGIRARTSAAVMGWSMTTALLQPFGILQSIPRVGGKWILRGMKHWVGDMARLENSAALIREKSEMMRHRSTTFNRDIREVSERLHRGESDVKRVFDASLFVMMQKLQLVADIPTWYGAYEKALAENADEARAVALADQAVLDAQGGGSVKDLAGIARGNEFKRAATMFYSFFSATHQMVVESTAKADFKSPRAIAGWVADMGLLLIAPVLAQNIVYEILRGGSGDDEPEEKAIEYLREVLAFGLGTIVGVRELSGAVQGFDYNGPAITRALLEIPNLFKAAGKALDSEEDFEEKDFRRAVKATMTILGLPATQFDRTWRGWKAWQEGEAGPGAILLGPPPRD